MGWSVITTTLWPQQPLNSTRCHHSSLSSGHHHRSKKSRILACASHGSPQKHSFDDGDTYKGRRSNGNPPASGFHPSVWGDFFLEYSNPTTPLQLKLMEQRVQKIKVDVTKLLSSQSTTCSLFGRVHLIYALQRLCLDYLFEEEINTVLAQIIDTDVSNCDLHTVSLWFYILRSHGHRVSADVFATFRDEDGRFQWHDPRDILSLYNAAHLRTHGETILDEAICFTTGCLNSMLPYLIQEGTFAREVTCALTIPIPQRARIYDYKNYISMYEKDTMIDRKVLALAKLNSNLMQKYYQQELKLLTRWWKDLQLEGNLSFCRDRIVECFFCMTGAYFEPVYSRGRIISTLVMATMIILDDIYDTYATSEECDLFTKCIECWDIKASQDLPDNLKLILGKVLDTFEIIENYLEAQEKYRLSYLRNILMMLVKSFNKEVKWSDDRYVPGSVDEHLQVSATSSSIQLLCCGLFIGMGEIATTESFEWVSSMPKMVYALCIILRLSDDLSESYEEAMTFGVASTIDSCMKEHDISMALAREKIKSLIEESWKDINDEWLKPDRAQPKRLLERIFNLARAVGFIYKQGSSELETIVPGAPGEEGQQEALVREAAAEEDPEADLLECPDHQPSAFLRDGENQADCS